MRPDTSDVHRLHLSGVHEDEEELGLSGHTSVIEGPSPTWTSRPL